MTMQKVETENMQEDTPNVHKTIGVGADDEKDVHTDNSNIN